MENYLLCLKISSKTAFVARSGGREGQVGADRDGCTDTMSRGKEPRPAKHTQTPHSYACRACPDVQSIRLALPPDSTPTDTFLIHWVSQLASACSWLLSSSLGVPASVQPDMAN
ncbi:hypothetical protein INR49_001530 [Caranx melampygus]|nr:hypothetical protein INR49_001530 [Caranx melampygus]